MQITRLVVPVLLVAVSGCCCHWRTSAPTSGCTPDSVKVGSVCVDKYEASVWNIPNPTTANATVVKHVLDGTVTQNELQNAGATLLAPAKKPAPGGPPNCTGTGSEYGPSFRQDGNWTAIPGSNPPTPGIYAVSIPGVLPSACLSWFQAAQACAISGKRLPTNQEWQLAAAGTPDTTTDCNEASGMPSTTGALPNCRSAWGTFDMVGNVAEWVAEWVPLSTDCPGWGPFSGDMMCLAGAATITGPGALMRGGSCCAPGNDPGVLAVDGGVSPINAINFDFGFRCAR
jgi:formylglycine-generating enzyme required for sulfatase activity